MPSEPNRKPRVRGLFFYALIFFAGAAFAGLFNMGLEYTNRTEFCTSCHSMKTNLNELQETPHWKSRSGVHAGCSDCHVPKNFQEKVVAKVLAAKDVLHEIVGTIDTPEKYEAHRLDMAERVWAKMKARDSAECRNCHSFAHMDFSEQGKFARRKHQNATDRGQTCIDCHKGIGHKLPKGAKDAADEDKSGSDKPAQDKSAEAAPAQEKPAEAAPAESKPAEDKAGDAKPAEDKPAADKQG
jgi:cytochrome c-type protein NapC